MRYFCKKATKEYSFSAYIQALGAHQHTLKAFKTQFWAEMYTDQNMLKNALFFGKSWKICLYGFEQMWIKFSYKTTS